MRPQDFIETARTLAQSGPRRPRKVDLRRAASTAYYGIFHTLCVTCADLLIGRTASTRRAWLQTYRALEHSFAKKRCKELKGRSFPDEIEDFASMFVAMQDKRHRSDYDPSFNLTKSEVLADIEACEVAMSGFIKCALEHRRAFAAFVLFRSRD